jgi:hypothetical protein
MRELRHSASAWHRSSQARPAPSVMARSRHMAP